MPACPRPLTTAAAADQKALLAIEPEQAIVVHREALPSQQDVQAPVTEAPPHMGQTSQPCPQFCVVGPAAPISHRHPYAADRSARLPLAHVQRRTSLSDSLSLGSGRHHFFASRASSAALSSRASAKSLSRKSRSPALQTLGLGYFEPAVLGLPVVEACLAYPVLAAQIGCLHASLVFLQDRNDLPSVCLLRFIVWSFLKARLLFVLD